MTNDQRDELLITVVTGLNNLQNTVNDMRVELKQEIRDSEERQNAKIDGLRVELKQEIKKSEERQNTKLENAIKESEERQNTRLEKAIKESEERQNVRMDNMKTEILETFEKSQEKQTAMLEFKIQSEAKAAIEVFKDIFRREKDTNKKIIDLTDKINSIKTK